LTIVVAGETLLGECCRSDWALVWSFVHMGDLVGFEVSENLSASSAEVITVSSAIARGGPFGASSTLGCGGDLPAHGWGVWEVVFSGVVRWRPSVALGCGRWGWVWRDTEG
jgi:hypothetical protein